MSESPPTQRDTEQAQDAVGRWLMLAIGLGALAGGLIGWLAPDVAAQLKLLGTIFLRTLRMLVVPLVVVSMVCGVAGLGDVRRLGGVGGITVAYYLTTSALALALGLGLVASVQPGVGVDLAGASAPEVSHVAGWQEMVRGLFATNLVAAASHDDLLPLILFSLAFGAALSTLGERGKPLLDVFEALNAAIMRLVHWVMLVAPIGILGLVAGRLGQAGGGAGVVRVLQGLGAFALCVVGGLLVHGVLTLSLVLGVLGRRNPLRYLKGGVTALLTAFATASSVATLPVTFRCVEEENGVSPASSRFVLPLGATINMDGTALYEAIACVFVAQAYGIELTLGKMLLLFVVASLSSIGAAGIPSAGLVTLVIVFQVVGLPLEGIGLLLAIDWILDRFRTAVNVWGDAIGAAVVEHAAEAFDLDLAPAD